MYCREGLPITLSSPSFLIKDACLKYSHDLRWDSVNSKKLIKRARSIYFNYLSSHNSFEEPKGVVINKNSDQGAIVFTTPTLLPNEHYLSIELLTKKKALPRCQMQVVQVYC